MGLLPTCYADQDIKFRIPYTMDGERDTAASTTGDQFTSSTFLHTVDKPFEVHRVVIRVIGLDSSSVPLRAQDESLYHRVRLTIEDTSKNEKLTKSSTLASILTSFSPVSQAAWEWEMPYTIERSEGFTVTVDTLAVPTGTTSFRVAVAFQGYLVVIAPPSETR